MSKRSVAVCGIARDCSTHLSQLIPKLEALGRKFKSCKVIVVENNSQDGTADVIRAWAARNRNVIPILFSASNIAQSHNAEESETSRDFNRSRIARIAFARNLYLEALQEIQQTDYVVIVDLDILDFSIPGIANSFEQRAHWDCVTSTGLRYTLRSPFNPSVYWDTYAYEPPGGFPGGVQRLTDIRRTQKLLRMKLKSGHLIPALSAFGGLAIYRSQSLTGQRYDTVGNDNPEVPFVCEHVYLHRSIAQANKDFRLVINPLQTLRYESAATTVRRSIKRLIFS